MKEHETFILHYVRNEEPNLDAVSIMKLDGDGMNVKTLYGVNATDILEKLTGEDRWPL